MALAVGEYGFECLDCRGRGEIEIAADEPDHPDHGWVTCEDCDGSGEVVYEEDEAEERMELLGDKPRWIRLAAD
jgi:DnaJ-class molecular chaperone